MLSITGAAIVRSVSTLLALGFFSFELIGQEWHLQSEVVATETALINIQTNADPAQAYAAFNAFARTHFGAETDPLIYQRFGDTLALRSGGTYVYASETSAVVAFATNLPALTRVLYRIGSSAEQQTAERERSFSLHIHHLTGLQRNTTYTWRPSMVDERGNTVVGPQASFTTKGTGSATVIPAVSGTHVITTSGAYVLTHDIHANRTAIEIQANDVTLDLGGRTVTYALEALPDSHFTDQWNSYITNGSYGIKASGRSNVTVLNGRVIQGSAGVNANHGNSESSGFIPVYIQGGSGHRVAGVEVDYHSPQNSGIRIRGAGNNVTIHHNLIRDRGTRITNRHSSGSPRAICLLAHNGGNHVIHHNLVARARQNGVGSANHAHDNEIYGDSWSTNSFMIPVRDGATTSAPGYHDNRVFATGFNPYGFGWASENLNIHDNFVSMFGLDLQHRWIHEESWGDINLLAAMRITNYGSGGDVRKDLHYWNNLIIMRGRAGSHVQGSRFYSDTTIENTVFRDNIVKVEVYHNQASHSAPIVPQGQNKLDALPIYYRNNRLISNVAVIQFGEPYGKGHNHHFENNSFEKIGNQSNFRTFVFDGGGTSQGHILHDNNFGIGTSYDDVHWRGTGNASEYRVAWTLDLAAPSGAAVSIRDALNAVVYTGIMPSDGQQAIRLFQAQLIRGGNQKVMMTPHVVSVTVGGVMSSQTIEMDQRKGLNFGSGGTVASAPNNLIANATSSTAVSLSWNDNSSNETIFRIERALGNGSFALVATVGANVTSYANTSLSAESAYRYRVRAQNAAGNSAWSNIAEVSTPGVGGPYGGTARPIPGRIEAEHFDEGGQNGAYFDTTAGNSGGAFRETDVDIQACSDVGGGSNIAWITTGEWLEFSVNVASAGIYRLDARVASTGSNGSFRALFGGVDKTGTVAAPNTGGWQNWATVNGGEFSLAAGEQVMRIHMVSAGFNLNWVELSAVGSAGNQAPVVSAANATPAPVIATTTTVSATASDDGGEGALTYTWSSAPATAAFSPNGTNGAKSSTATFTAAGSYALTVTARDAGNLIGTRNVAVTVQQTATTVTVPSATATVVAGGAVPFSAQVRDQFGAMIPGAPLVWSLQSGGGTVTGSGGYTAPDSAGVALVQVANGPRTAVITVTITASVGDPMDDAGSSASSSQSCGGFALGLLLLLCSGLLFTRRT